MQEQEAQRSRAGRAAPGIQFIILSLQKGRGQTHRGRGAPRDACRELSLALDLAHRVSGAVESQAGMGRHGWGLVGKRFLFFRRKKLCKDQRPSCSNDPAVGARNRLPDRFRDLRAAGFGVERGRSSLTKRAVTVARREMSAAAKFGMRPPLTKHSS